MTMFYMVGGYSFPHILPDPEGDVGIDILPSLHPEGANLRCGIRKGTHYTPGTHPFTAWIRILTGMGLFFFGNRTIPYYAGSVFVVGAYVPHSFIRVARDTIFLKEIPSLVHEK